MLAPLIIVAALFIVSADGAAYLFKKLERGHWATKFRSLSDEAKTAALACIPLYLLLSIALAVIIFRFFGLQTALILAIFVFVAHFSYRLPMTISDKEARNHASRIERKIKQQKMIRRYFSLVFALFAMSVAAAAIFLLRDKIFALL